MNWNREQISGVALSGAAADYGAFERIGLTERENARVLDVGCFDGFNTVLKFAPYGNIAQVVGLDPEPEALALAVEATDDERFSWQQGDFAGFSSDEPFDLIYMGHVFQHLPEKQEAARKAFQLLKPGGWLVIKTVDDSLKASSPDPNRVMERVFARYEQVVRPRRSHTAHTDRNNGAKCHSLLVNAGFCPVDVAFHHTSTAGMGREEREAFFERMTYFRNPPIDGARDAEMTELLEEWRQLFLREDYFFDSPTLVACGQKPMSQSAHDRGRSKCHALPQERMTFGTSPVMQARSADFTIERMVEADLGEVMAIELRSFPNPWAPVAFATELRHNRDAVYAVARDAAGKVRGYIGWWVVDGSGLITHVAVDAAVRRQGLGAQLVECACCNAADRGAAEMRLQLRDRNGNARALYVSCGFTEVGRIPDYYANPVDDALVMARPLEGRQPAERTEQS